MGTRVERGHAFYSDRCKCGKVSEIELMGFTTELLALCRVCATEVIRLLAEDVCVLDGKRRGQFKYNFLLALEVVRVV